MTTEQFTYWLQGFFEVSGDKKLNEKQVTIIKDHLALVFDKVTPDRDSKRVKINMNSILEKKQEPEGLSVKPINQKGFGGKRPQIYC